jgi:hypothetical protein
VKQSLRNAGPGWQFKLKNTLGSGYAHQLLPLTVDGAVVALGDASFILDGKETSFADVSKANTFSLAMNREITIVARGPALSPGVHKVAMHFVVPGFGKIGFDFTDMVTVD